jgi:pyruvate/2-oxoglutarate dehydrogenase complex dihydrolipoamide dehydrogenase (E3) component/uncharacterized membrane protein YdjX (TVP38/TMEM64 family)
LKRRKLLLVLVLLGLVAAFFALDLGRYFSLDALKGARADLAALYAARPALLLCGYALVYVAVFALALPVGVVMTLVGGALFGLVAGTVVVSFASTAGATLAFLASRYLLADAVRQRFGARLAEVDRGIERDGAFYLFTLRLIPAIPPAAINLLFGLTRLRTWTFYWVSQLGMLAGTVVFVNAGTQLAKLESPAGILSPGVWLSLVLLGIFPLAARKIIDAVRRRRIYARWAHRRPARYDRNLVVIGAGAAGLVTAYIGAAAKARVTLVEQHLMGGDCLNTGCVPSKALIRSATLAHQIRHGARYGIASAEFKLDFAAVMERVAAVVRAVAPHDSVARYTALGVDVRIGRARILDPWHVQITGADGRVQVLATRAIVVATGARPAVPPLPGLDEVGYLTSDTLWGLRELPRRLAVLGGGPIGCELAQAFARLGSQVTLLELAPRLLMREDVEVSACARQALEADGVAVLTGHRALRCERVADGKFIVALTEAGERRIAFDVLLCAVGRVARLEGYGLEELGIPVQRTLATDAWLQTVYPNILAAGDVVGPDQFTHIAAQQAWTAAVNGLFGGYWKTRFDASGTPRCTFIDPEVARVGLNVQEARAQGVAYELTRYGLDENDRALADSSAQGWVQVLTVPGSDRILGVTIVGAHAGELLAEYVLAMTQGLGLNRILGTIHVYPTLAEANKAAAGAWKRAHPPARLLRWAERFHAWRRG